MFNQVQRYKLFTGYIGFFVGFYWLNMWIKWSKLRNFAA